VAPRLETLFVGGRLIAFLFCCQETLLNQVRENFRIILQFRETIVSFNPPPPVAPCLGTIG
jgi:hypothetical protein